MSEFTHIGTSGQVRMVDVTEKDTTSRTAIARGQIFMTPDTLEKIECQAFKKGNVLETARIAGVMAAKKTADLIPMCHPLNVTHVKVDFLLDPDSSAIQIEATARIVGQTGVEMEALTAVSVAALTIYDMCKSHDRKMRISNICLLEKSGGKSGTFIRSEIKNSDD